MTFRYLSVCAGACLFLCARVGYAQTQQVGPITGGNASPAVAVVAPGNGVPISDGATLHAGLTVEGGYDSNVFYTDTAVKSSGVLRVSPFLDLTNIARNGDVPQGLYFDLRAALTYREYLSSDSNITKLRSFTPTVSANLEHNSTGTLVLGLSDTYSRLQDAPYTEDSPDMIIRDNNLAVAQLRWSPGGGRLQGLLRLTNMVDWFETDVLKPANSMTNEAMLDLSWRWLPKTALYLQVRQGYIYYLNNDPTSSTLVVAKPDGTSDGKYSSYPFRAVTGIRGLITEKTSLALALGYQNAFYAFGPSTSGFLGSTTAMAELVVLPLTTTKIAFGVHHDFQNSVIGNFYYDDGVYALLTHQTLGRLVAQLWGAYDHRQYHGLPMGVVDPRLDDLIQVTALADYYVRSWAFVGLSYMLAHNTSNEVGDAAASGANYTKHQIFGRIGVTY